MGCLGGGAKEGVTPSMKLHIKNFKDHSSDLCQKKRNDMTIPGICGR